MGNPAAGKKLLFSLILVLLSLTALEFFFRFLPEPPRAADYRSIYNPELAFPKFYLKDAKLFWRLRPSQLIQSDFVIGGSYRINAAGFRDREFSEKPASGQRRVLCLGTSVTFGWGVGQNEPFPQVLQAANQEWEVYNCGQTGYSSLQGKRILSDLLPKYKPQAVVIEFIWNDVLPGFGGRPDSRQKMLPPSVLLAQNFLAHFAVYRWGRYLLLRSFAVQPETGGLPRVLPEEYGANLQEIIDGCRAHQARPIFVLPPAPKPQWFGNQKGRYQKLFYGPFQRYAGEMRKLASNNHISLVDADSFLAGELSIWENLPEDFVHPSARAHERIAGLLDRVLSEAQTLPRGK